ncbi:MAG: DUF5343 domain-containing protein [Dehalococcoidales bacterium]|nr:DUF5343 domain-containing protein [Dehalococcoidales bacterium]
MIIEKRQKRLPPYVSYRTFYNFLEHLQQHMPSRIDRSYWGDILSGSTGTQLMAALRFLNLIDINGKPTELLKPLVESNGETRTRLLNELTNDAFDFVCQSSLDLQSATYAQLQEVFHHTFQLTDDVSRKCVKFFIDISRDARIPLSPFILKRTRSTHSTTGIKAGSKKAAIRTNRNALIPQAQDEIPRASSWDSMLLAKFPNFDPSWSDELKMKWFAAFDELLKKGLNKS